MIEMTIHYKRTKSDVQQKASLFPLSMAKRMGSFAPQPIHFNYPDVPRKKGCFLINTLRLILKLGSGYWDFFG